jgi:hypothetical protein
MRAFLLLLCRQAGLLDDHKLARKVEFDIPSVASLAVWRERRGPRGKDAGEEQEFENGKVCLGCGIVPISLDHESTHRRHQSTNKRGDKGEVAGTSVGGGRELGERREWSPLERRGFNIRPQYQSQFDSQQLVSLTIFRLYYCRY